MTHHLESTPNALQQLRLFVAEDDTVQPWASIEELMQHLVTEIGRHGDDDPWRAQLEQLVLAQQATDSADSPWRSLISPENLGALLDEIQGPAGVRPSRSASLLRGMSVPAILGLSAMTMAIGCNNLCPEAGGIPADEQETYCELVAYINDADINGADRDDVLDCLPDLSDATRQELVDLFDSYSAEEIVEYLVVMSMTTCDAGDDDDDDDDTGH